MAIDVHSQTHWNLEFAAKLENLSKLMREHPNFNWSQWDPGKIRVDDAAEMAAVVKAIGRGKWKKDSNTFEFQCILKASDNAHFDIVVTASHAAVCEKVGEEEVETETPISDAVLEAVRAGLDKVVTTKVKPIWKCPPSILAIAPDLPDDIVEDGE